MKNLLFNLFLVLLVASCSSRDAMEIDLSGNWKFKMDIHDEGVEGRWFESRLPDLMVLPGSMMEQRLGLEITLETQWTGSIYDSSWFFNPHTEPYRQPGNLMFPFWLTPEKYYAGAAWYQRVVKKPSNWDGQRVFLHLERPHWETTVWVNESKAGMQNSLSVPHVYDITDLMSKGENVITIRVDNRIKDINVGPDSHSVTDHTQGNWNGIVGDIKLIARPNSYIQNVQVYPDVASNKVRLVGKMVNKSPKKFSGEIEVLATLTNVNVSASPVLASFPVTLEAGEQLVELEFDMGENVQLWDEFHPAFYRLEVSLKTDAGATDVFRTQFGMRTFTAEGTRFAINGRPVWLRGTVECAAHPLTGYAPMDKEYWKEIYQKAMAFGINHFRFHSWCPPRAAFEAADELGVYLQPEGPFWTNHGTWVGDGLPVDQYIIDECDRILEEYGNHPSFVMFAYGNEPAGRNQIPFLNELVEYWMEKDNRRLYTHAAIGRSWPLAPSNEFIIRAESRGLPWDQRPQSLFDYAERIAPYDVPYVAHEMGQYCVFPDFNEIPKYTGVYQPKNFVMFKAELERKRMGDQAREFFMASGHFQVICYKSEIEASLRTPGNAGTQLLALNDFPGQGSAIVGVTDVFWDAKDYVKPEDFRRFFGTTVPLTRFPKFVYTNDEELLVEAEVAHFGEFPLQNVTPVWKITDENGQVIDEGTLPPTNIPFGNSELGAIRFPLDFSMEAGKYNLELSFKGFVNDWDFWVYPAELPELTGDEIFITDDFNDAAVEILNNGGDVLLLAAGNVEKGKDVVQYFRPVFWNTSWFQMRPPHTLGILTNPNHLAMADFPTDFHSNLQWWELLHNQQVMNLDNFPAEFKPIVQPIDTWFINRKLGLVFEVRVGEGRLLVCSADLDSDLDNRIVARQMRHSLMNYMLSDDFNPAITVDPDLVAELFTEGDYDIYDVHTAGSPMDLIPEQ
ncbi:sugar-binding domain-containing protein [Alkalitalea saponilacus]|uniref:beta-galactosidase n=1 Tax=Alkalitalea saponilacus TaxID=889453 RepID=A0A1T5C858_9BACT|nr:sugar-binding domain-containing protein [Alkalitalea saponilacus]ASB49766.1 beta-glucuronidase [Alkalitalea saponilacus]SKB55569.1 Glycosyl hydrolases family 2, TIM barrel domain [Alkalitalea saponilacus]